MYGSQVAAEYPLRILIAVTFHFREARLQYLFQALRGLAEFPVDVLDVVIVTNVNDQMALKQIEELCGPLFLPFPGRRTSKRTLSFESFPSLADAWLLPWSHKHLITDKFLSAGLNYTHFIYLEDDILLSFDNLRYFLHYRDLLNREGLIPSFLRVEYNDADNRLYLVDQVGVSDFNSRKHIDVDGYTFVNLDYPYNALFILDRDLALEYVSTRSFDRERSKAVQPDWDVATRAAMGLCFENPPPGFATRYVSPVDPVTLMTPSWSWVYHLPNNYAKNRLKPFAKTRTKELFAPGKDFAAWVPPSRVARFVARLSGKENRGPKAGL